MYRNCTEISTELWKQMKPLEISVNLSSRANEKCGILKEETVHAEDELAISK